MERVLYGAFFAAIGAQHIAPDLIGNEVRRVAALVGYYKAILVRYGSLPTLVLAIIANRTFRYSVTVPINKLIGGSSSPNIVNDAILCLFNADLISLIVYEYAVFVVLGEIFKASIPQFRLYSIYVAVKDDEGISRLCA